MGDDEKNMEKTNTRFNNNIVAIYTGIGIAFGMCFPIGAYFFSLVVDGYRIGEVSFFEMHSYNSLLFMIDSAPLFLGLFAMLGGINQSKAQKSNQQMKETLMELEKGQLENQNLLCMHQRGAEYNVKLSGAIRMASDELLTNSRWLKDAMRELGIKDLQLKTYVKNVDQDIKQLKNVYAQLLKNVDGCQSDVLDIGHVTQETNVSIQFNKKTISTIYQEIKKLSGELETLDQNAATALDIIVMIQNISKKVNLLSLNAAIESSRAGEAGRGFAVVANEIKGLSTETDKALESISRIIRQITLTTDEISLQVGHMQKEGLVADENSGLVSKNFESVLGNVLKVQSSTQMSVNLMKNEAAEIDDIQKHMISTLKLAEELERILDESRKALEVNEEKITFLNNIVSDQKNNVSTR